MDPIVVEVPAAFMAAAQCCARLFELAESARQTVAAGVQAAQCELHAVIMNAMAFEDSRLLVDGGPRHAPARCRSYGRWNATMELLHAQAQHEIKEAG